VYGDERRRYGGAGRNSHVGNTWDASKSKRIKCAAFYIPKF